MLLLQKDAPSVSSACRSNVKDESRHHARSGALRCERAARAGRAAGGGVAAASTLARQVVARFPRAGVVVLPVRGLLELQDVECGRLHELLDNDGADDQDHHKEEHEEVHDRVADDTALAKLRLLERVDRRADLAAAINVSS